MDSSDRLLKSGNKCSNLISQIMLLPNENAGANYIQYWSQRYL